MIINILILVALIKLLIAQDKPIVCAGIYTAVRFVSALLLGASLLTLLMGSAIAFALAFLYFW